MHDRYEIHEFEGNLIWEDCTVDNVRIYVKLDQLKYGPIKGHFYCDEELDRNKDIAYFVIEPNYKYTYSNKLRLSKCQVYRYSGGEVHKYRFTSQEYQDMSIEPIPNVSDVKDLTMVFNIDYHPVLVAPYLIETFREIKTHEDYQKSLITLYKENNIKLDYSLTVESLNHSIDGLKGDFEFLTQHLIIKINSPSKSIDESINEGKELVENMLTLLSFWTRKRISFYKYECVVELQDNSMPWHIDIINGNKRTVYESERDEFDLTPKDFIVYIETSFPVFLNIMDQYNLKEAIWDYVTSFEAEYLEKAFMSLCTSLEAIKDGYLRINKSKYNLKEKQFDKLKRAVSSFIENYSAENNLNPDIVPYITEKLPELGRPTFRSVLTNIISELNVETKDLETDKIYDFFAYRNELFHKGKIKDNDFQQLWIEKDRLRVLIERIILRILEFPLSLHAYPDRPIDMTDKKIFSKEKFI